MRGGDEARGARGGEAYQAHAQQRRDAEIEEVRAFGEKGILGPACLLRRRSGRQIIHCERHRRRGLDRILSRRLERASGETRAQHDVLVDEDGERRLEPSHVQRPDEVQTGAPVGRRFGRDAVRDPEAGLSRRERDAVGRGLPEIDGTRASERRQNGLVEATRERGHRAMTEELDGARSRRIARAQPRKQRERQYGVTSDGEEVVVQLDARLLQHLSEQLGDDGLARRRRPRSTLRTIETHAIELAARSRR